MTTSKTTESYTIGVSNTYTEAKAAIDKIKLAFSSRLSTLEYLTTVTLEFEDSMNLLVGVLKSESTQDQTYIKSQVSQVIEIVKAKGLTIELNPYFDSTQEINQTISTYKLGKRLYPKTEVVESVSTNEKTTQQIIDQQVTVNGVSVSGNDSIASVGVDQDLESVELNLQTQSALEFSPNDENAVEQARNYQNEPISQIGEVNSPLISDALLNAANSASSNSESTLEQWLTSIHVNPLTTKIEELRTLISEYANNNFSTLNSTLATISADTSLASQYQDFKNAIAGPDGLSGALGIVNAYKEHTDRISGLIVEDENENSGAQDSSITFNLSYSSLPQNTEITILTLDSRKFRSAKYFVQASANLEHQMTEYSILHDNTNVYGREVYTTYTIDPFVRFISSLGANTITINANSSIQNTDLIIYGIRLPISQNVSAYGTVSQKKIIANHQILSAYYNDGQDYISQQSSALLNYSPDHLKTSIEDAITALTESSFSSLSTGEKQNTISRQTLAINNIAQGMKSVIQSDVDAYSNLSKKSDVLGEMYNIVIAYQDDKAKNLLDLTLVQSVKENL